MITTNQWFSKNKYGLFNFPGINSIIDVNNRFTTLKFINSANKFILPNGNDNKTYTNNQNIKSYLQHLNNQKNIYTKETDNNNTIKKYVRIGISKKEKPINTCIKCINQIIYPTIQQREILQSYMTQCKNVYDKCIDKYNENNNYFNSGIKVKVQIFEELYGTNKKEAPYDMLTDEVNKFIANLKSNLTQIKNKTKKHFTFKYKDTTKTQSINIPKNSINKTSIFPQKLNKMKGLNLIERPEHDCRLIYNPLHKRYKISIPTTIQIKQKENREKIVAIDPGINKFISYYSDSKYGYIGEKVTKVLKTEIEKGEKYDKILKQNKNKKGKAIKNKKSIKKKRLLNNETIRNKIKELHNQTAKYLCDNYEIIVLPHLEVSKLSNVKRKIKEIKESTIEENIKKTELKKLQKSRKIERRMLRYAYKLSHYKFKEILINKSKEYNSKVEEISEAYTSQICTKCGKISKKYENRIKECLYCGLKIDRDINASRNIYLKYVSENNLLW